MMEFVKELHEARLIRTKDDLNLSFGDICENLYLILLCLEFLVRTKKGRNIAIRYASETSKYINYGEFRTNATDLYNLLYFVQETPEHVEKIFGSEDSRKMRERTTIPRMELNRWLITLETNRDIYFLMRMEQALNIKNSDSKEIRRMLQYRNPTDSDVQIMASRILNAVRFKMTLLDLKPDLETLLTGGKVSFSNK